MLDSLSGYCFSCFLVGGGKKQHSLLQCPHWRYGRCFGCGQIGCFHGHECRKQLRKLVEGKSICVTCFLPMRVFGVCLHETVGNRCPYADTVLHGVILLYRLKSQQWLRSRTQRTFTSLYQFVSYLCNSDANEPLDAGIPSVIKFLDSCI